MPRSCCRAATAAERGGRRQLDLRRGLQSLRSCQCVGVSRACRDQVESETHNFTETSQDIVEANLTGALFALPGGDVRFAVTGTYRENSYEYDPDPARRNGDVIGTLASVPTEGAINVKELGFELLLPILHDVSFAETLELNLGYRISDYNITRHGQHLSRREVVAAHRLCCSAAATSGRPGPPISASCSAPARPARSVRIAASGGDPCDVRSAARLGANGARSVPSAWAPGCRPRSSTCSSTRRSRSPRPPAAARRSSPRRPIRLPPESCFPPRRKAPGCRDCRCRRISTTSASATSSRRSRRSRRSTNATISTDRTRTIVRPIPSAS